MLSSCTQLDLSSATSCFVLIHHFSVRGLDTPDVFFAQIIIRICMKLIFFELLTGRISHFEEATLSTRTTDKLIISASQHQAAFDKRDANYQDNNLKNNIWLSIISQLGWLGGCCLLRLVTSICKTKKKSSEMSRDILKYIQNRPWYSCNPSFSVPTLPYLRSVL